jgi:hypothetical protein
MSGTGRAPPRRHGTSPAEPVWASQAPGQRLPASEGAGSAAARAGCLTRAGGRTQLGRVRRAGRSTTASATATRAGASTCRKREREREGEEEGEPVLRAVVVCEREGERESWRAGGACRGEGDLRDDGSDRGVSRRGATRQSESRGLQDARVRGRASTAGLWSSWDRRSKGARRRGRRGHAVEERGGQGRHETPSERARARSQAQRRGFLLSGRQQCSRRVDRRTDVEFSLPHLVERAGQSIRSGPKKIKKNPSEGRQSPLEDERASGPALRRRLCALQSRPAPGFRCRLQVEHDSRSLGAEFCGDKDCLAPRLAFGPRSRRVVEREGRERRQGKDGRQGEGLGRGMGPPADGWGGRRRRSLAAGRRSMGPTPSTRARSWASGGRGSARSRMRFSSPLSSARPQMSRSSAVVVAEGGASPPSEPSGRIAQPRP